MVPDNPQGRGKGRTRARARDAAGNELDAADSEALLRGSRQDDAAEALLRGSRQDDEEGLLSFGSDNLMEEDSGCSEDSLGSGGGCYATIHGGSDSEGRTRGQRDGRAFANWGQPGSAKLQTSEVCHHAPSSRYYHSDYRCGRKPVLHAQSAQYPMQLWNSNSLQHTVLQRTTCRLTVQSSWRLLLNSCSCFDCACWQECPGQATVDCMLLVMSESYPTCMFS